MASAGLRAAPLKSDKGKISTNLCRSKSEEDEIRAAPGYLPVLLQWRLGATDGAVLGTIQTDAGPCCEDLLV